MNRQLVRFGLAAPLSPEPHLGERLVAAPAAPQEPVRHHADMAAMGQREEPKYELVDWLRCREYDTITSFSGGSSSSR